MIFHVIALLRTNQRAITLFCTDSGVNGEIARSFVTKFRSARWHTINLQQHALARAILGINSTPVRAVIHIHVLVIIFNIICAYGV